VTQTNSRDSESEDGALIDEKCFCDDGMIVVPLLNTTDVGPCPRCQARFYKTEKNNEMEENNYDS
jgi:uncharacterized paraquat-inducible protein A